MKFRISHIIIAVLTVLCLSLIISSNDCQKVVDEVHTVDTCYIYKTDTIIEYIPKTVVKTIKDTVFIKAADGSLVAAPIVQKYFSNTNVYDLWVSGVEPFYVDSIKVYNKTSQKIITNEVERNIVTKERKFFVGGGISTFNGTLTPYMVVSFQNKKEWLYGLNLGIYDNNLFYGGSISFRIK